MKIHKQIICLLHNKMLLTLSALFVLMGVSSIIAFLLSGDKTDRDFVIGGNRIELIEEFDPPKELVPGTSFTKDVMIQNVGPNKCYVRIKAVFNNSDIGDYCTLDWNTTDYVYNSEDGYYYYTKELDLNEITESLFTTVLISNDTPESVIQDFNIIVYAESIQSATFDDYEHAWSVYEMVDKD